MTVKSVLTVKSQSLRQALASHTFELPELPKAGSFPAAPKQAVVAVRLCDRFRQLWWDTLGDDHPHTLSAAHHLACVLRAVGEHERAREVDQDTLAHFRRVLGHDHPRTLISASNLAADLRALGESERTRDLDGDILGRFHICSAMTIPTR